jgi:hypothetical protein
MQRIKRQISRASMCAAATWFGGWVLALGLLAAVPSDQPGGAAHAMAHPVYYTYAMTNRIVQDLDGTVSTQVRALRPVIN